MKISDLFSRAQRSEVGKALADKSRAPSSSPTAESASDRTTISPEAAQLSKLSAQSEQERSRAVRDLSERVRNGKYLSEVSTKSVAEKITKRLFGDN